VNGTGKDLNELVAIKKSGGTEKLDRNKALLLPFTQGD
jgi:hypothetical protein